MRLKQIAVIIVGTIAIAGCQDAKKGNDKQQDQQPQKQQQVSPGQQMPQTNAADVTDEELKLFMTINKKMQSFNQEMQQKMAQIIQEKGMDIKQFTQIQKSQQNPDSKVDVSQDQMNQYKAIMREMQKDQAQMQQKAQKIIQDEGLTMKRFQEIRNQISNDPTMQNKLREMQ